jgi:hypothetical protein
MASMKKKKLFEQEPPTLGSLGEANALIRELWDKLREYEDRLAASSRNSSRSPSSDSPAAKAERKKLKRLVAEIRLALNLDTRGTEDH